MWNRFNPSFKITFFLMVVFCAGGCSPHTSLNVTPPVNTPVRIGEAPQLMGIFTENWWTIFSDPVLERLMERGLRSNLDMEEAYARFSARQALLKEMRSPLFPSVMTDYSLSRSRRPGFSGKDLGTDYRYGMSLSYELDLWRKIRSGVSAASFELNATERDIGALRIAISTEIARNYFLIGELLSRLEILERQKEIQAKKKVFLSLMYHHGTSRSERLYLVEEEIMALDARIRATLSELEGTENAFWVLLGQYSDEKWRPRPLSDHVIPRIPERGIPVSILLNRPDVKAEEYRVKAQDERVAQAISQFFPALGLNLGYGRSRNASSFGIISGIFWSMAFNASWMIFDGGARGARIEQERSALIAALIRYHRAILKAFEEAKTASVLNENSDERLHLLEQAMKNANRLVELERSRFRQGISSGISVLDRESAYLDSLLQYNLALRDCLLARIQLVKALGGAWKSR